jgi:HAD superfamily hydrolase (TIGR01509 family)
MPPWSAIDTIMFDMDGTLLDLHFDSYFWQHLVPKIYSETHSVSEDSAQEFIKHKYQQVYGTLDWYCLDYWQRELDLDITAMKATISHKINIRPNVEKLLRELQASTKRVLLITNAHPASLDLKMRHTGINEYFHQLISSHSLNLAKENHGFWESLQQLEHYDPERTILFDDSLPVLRQAKKEGIRHLYAIEKPDSQKPNLEENEFPQIRDFDHILPSLMTGE